MVLPNRICLNASRNLVEIGLAVGSVAEPDSAGWESALAGFAVPESDHLAPPEQAAEDFVDPAIWNDDAQRAELLAWAIAAGALDPRSEAFSEVASIANAALVDSRREALDRDPAESATRHFDGVLVWAAAAT